MTKVKICGLSTPETLEAAIAHGADFVGLVFFPKSPRNISLETASRLADQARRRAKIVTLVVDADDQLLSDIRREVRPDYVQAHGRETPERIAAMRDLTGIAVYKALRVGTADDVAQAAAYKASAFMLYDAMPPKNSVLPGGNGLAFDWTILKDAAHPFMLAGGLTPGNVASAIAVTRADMVDVSSGVETSPGVKDVHLIAKFIEAAKAAR